MFMALATHKHLMKCGRCGMSQMEVYHATFAMTVIDAKKLRDNSPIYASTDTVGDHHSLILKCVSCSHEIKLQAEAKPIVKILGLLVDT